MNKALTEAAAFRHVVFPDSVGGYGRAMNLAPRRPDDGFASGPASRPDESIAPGAESLFRWLFSRAGLNFRNYKPETLNRRLPACLRAVRASSPAQARAVLERSPHLYGAALDALLIGVTGFFRDEAVFASLAGRTLPALLGRWTNGACGRPLRVWSAGCSDGAELYSVAILLAERGAFAAGPVELLGTDCRPDAMARAAAGGFDAGAVKGVPAALLGRYFTCDAGRYHVCESIRAAARWRAADALGAARPGEWDLVLCRNVAIYLQPEAAAALWAGLAGALRPGGVLVLGKAERPLGIGGLAPEGPCAWRRAGGE